MQWIRNASLAAAALGVVVAMSASPLPPQAKTHGKTLGEWGDAWWQWALSIPADCNPLSDTTGEFAAEGQSGPVWFLGGVFVESGVVERSITIPPGKALFFPIMNQVWVNLPLLGDAEWSPEQEAAVRELNSAAMDSACALSCTVDGVSLPDLEQYRCATPADGEFMIAMPENDLWGLGGWGLPLPGIYGPTVQEGYYVMLPPLSVGKHTLQFSGALESGFALEVTYNITVTPE